MGLGSVIFGAVVGAFVAGPVGAIVGAFIGAWLAQKDNGRKQGGPAEPEVQLWLRCFFQCLGKLAKSDGRVSEDEVAFVKSLLKEWKLPREVRQHLIACFNAGKNTSHSFSDLVATLAYLLPDELDTSKLRNDLMFLFCALVAADRIADPRERELLKNAAILLGAEQVVNAFFAEFDGADNSYASPENDLHLEECYKILEIAPEATDQEVKKAYRKKALMFHPDKAQGANLTERQIQQAKVRFQEINNAYETICKHRGMK